jgi:hypothetical protein
MRHILKDSRNEPTALKSYRSTPNARYTGFVDSEQLLKLALCKEQGFICCYCLQRISLDSTSVEHYITQKPHPDSLLSPQEHQAHELDYLNMLASCNNKGRNCSGIRGNAPLSIDPCKVSIESQIGYKNDGLIYAIDKNSLVEQDLETLKLGNTTKPQIKFGEHWLIENRAAVIEKIRQKLTTKGWTKTAITAEIKAWQSFDKEGYLEPYCQVAIFYLRKKLKAAV